MSITNHNQLRQAVFNKSFTTCCRYEFILGVLQDVKAIRIVELQKICLKGCHIPSGIRVNYLMPLEALGMITMYRTKEKSKKGYEVTLTEIGLAYLDEVKKCYAED